MEFEEESTTSHSEELALAKAMDLSQDNECIAKVQLCIHTPCKNMWEKTQLQSS
jgi:hypothetical protein